MALRTTVRNRHFLDRQICFGWVVEDLFLRLLGEPVEAVKERFLEPPSWLAFLTKAFSHPASTSLAPLSQTLPSEDLLGFLNIIKSLIEQALDELRKGLIDIKKTYIYLPFDPGTVETLLSSHLVKGVRVDCEPHHGAGDQCCPLAGSFTGQYT